MEQPVKQKKVVEKEYIFEINNFVYHCHDSIGQITDADQSDDGSISYRVNYCQAKDLKTGPRGGNGPIFKEGYPQPITEASDVLFVAALKEKQQIIELTKKLDKTKSNFNSLRHARDLILGQ